jgi:CBS domain-containing protein
MPKAYEVMTHALATCAPDASVTEVAVLMKERDIGSVLVVENNKLCGIITDRDLALEALTGIDDPLQTPIRKYMSTKIITGDAEWSLKQVARTMAAHQVRRLPIIQDGQLVGIVSLGDVALYEDREDVVSKSLQAISTPAGITAPGHPARNRGLIGLALVTALAATVVAWLTWSESGRACLNKFMKSDLYHTAAEGVTAARGKINEAGSSKSIRDLRRHIHSNINELSAQLPTIEYKPPKHKSIWFS